MRLQFCGPFFTVLVRPVYSLDRQTMLCLPGVVNFCSLDITAWAARWICDWLYSILTSFLCPAVHIERQLSLVGLLAVWVCQNNRFFDIDLVAGWRKTGLAHAQQLHMVYNADQYRQIQTNATKYLPLHTINFTYQRKSIQTSTILIKTYYIFNAIQTNTGQYLQKFSTDQSR